MCATPAPNELGGDDAETKAERIGAPPATWKRWRSPVKASDDEAPLVSGKQTMREGRTKIYGIGRNYNRELGSGAYRTGAAIMLDCNLATSMDIIRRNMEDFARDPCSTVRLMVEGDEFWYSDAPWAELFDMLVMVGDGATARAERLNACFEEAVPVGVCVCEEIAPAEGEGNTGGKCLATWLFRHDVIDGWRALRYLCRLVLGTADLTLDRLYARHENSQKQLGFGAKVCKALVSAAMPACFAPLALQKVLNVACQNSLGERRKFYAHVICDLPRLKQLGQERGVGSLTSHLTATILDAFFAANPSRQYANVASNVLFDSTSPEGNHMCLKVACIPRKGNTMLKTAQALGATSQKVADLWVAALSRKYALGHLPPPVEDFVDQRQKGLDFLVSSLPAYDRTTPTVLDLKVTREFTQWNPSIVYALGIGQSLFLDFYWEVPHDFGDDIFCSRISELLEATQTHTNLPENY